MLDAKIRLRTLGSPLLRHATPACFGREPLERELQERDGQKDQQDQKQRHTAHKGGPSEKTVDSGPGPGAPVVHQKVRGYGTQGNTHKRQNQHPVPAHLASTCGGLDFGVGAHLVVDHSAGRLRLSGGDKDGDLSPLAESPPVDRPRDAAELIATNGPNQVDLLPSGLLQPLEPRKEVDEGGDAHTASGIL